MNIAEEFPSKYLRASDLKNRDVLVKMSHVERESLGDDTKPVLYFVGKEKGIVLNKTNATAIMAAYGEDTDDWRDQEIVLFSAMVTFQGKTQPAIRVRAALPKDRKAAAPKQDPISSGRPAPAREPVERTELDDDIPF